MKVNSNWKVEGLSQAKCMTKLPVFENTELVIYPATALDKEVIVNYEMVAIISKLISYRAPVSSYIGAMKANLSPPQASGWKSRTYQDISMSTSHLMGRREANLKLLTRRKCQWD